MQNRPFTTPGNVCASVQRQANAQLELLTPFNIPEAMHSEPRSLVPSEDIGGERRDNERNCGIGPEVSASAMKDNNAPWASRGSNPTTPRFVTSPAPA
jgi:hypothetical protein